MDETPAPAALDARRRRLLFRATHRGTRENDILVGGFVAARIAAFTEGEMDAIEEILELPDPAVSDWLTGRAALPAGAFMLSAMRDAAIRGEGVSLPE
jgi:antitoxin CptB